MSDIAPELVALLESRFQAGASGFHCLVGPAESYPVQVKHVSIDKSRQADAASFTIELETNSPPGWAVPGGYLLIRQWYGSLDRTMTLDGIIDKIDDSRVPSERTFTITGRDRMALLLDPYQFIAIAPQGVDEVGAVRDSTNGVYLGWEVSAIVADVLDKAGWPSDYRLIWPSSYFVDEFVIADGTEFCAALNQLRQLVGFDHGCWGQIYRFAPPTAVDKDTDGNPIPVVSVTSGVDMMSLERAGDWLDMRTRVKVTGTFTSFKDAWTQTWSTSKIAAPTGVMFDASDPTHLKVVSGTTKRIYILLQSDQTIAASSAVIAGTVYPAGLSGDPADSSILWLLDAPWRIGSGTASKILKLNKSTLATLATYTLPAGAWADIKADGSVLWLANQTTGKFHSRSKTDGSAVGSFGPTYSGLRAVTRSDPSGLAIDGSDMYLYFAGLNEMWRVDASAPTVVLQVISTAGTGMFGGDMDTATHTDIYACNDSTGDTYKFALKEGVDNAVSIVKIAGYGQPDTEPTVPMGALEGTYGIRRYTLGLGVVTSAAQAATTGQADLAKRSHLRTVRDIGMVANPYLEAGMVIRAVDPVTGTDELGVVDTYRTDMSVSSSGGSYVATVAHIPWSDFS